MNVQLCFRGNKIIDKLQIISNHAICSQNPIFIFFRTEYDTVTEQKCETKYETQYETQYETKCETQYDTKCEVGNFCNDPNHK